MDQDYWITAWSNVEGWRYYLYPFYIILSCTSLIMWELLISSMKAILHILTDLLHETQIGKLINFLLNKFILNPLSWIKDYTSNSVIGELIIKLLNYLIASPLKNLWKIFKRKFFGDDDGDGSGIFKDFMDKPSDNTDIKPEELSKDKGKEHEFVEGNSKNSYKNQTKFESRLRGKLLTPNNIEKLLHNSDTLHNLNSEVLDKTEGLIDNYETKHVNNNEIKTSLSHY